jgi:nucleotide-binding universal stress UspA family protein
MTAELGNHLLVPIGFDVASRHAKQLALQIALKHGSRITLLHVLPELEPEPPPMKYGLDAIACLHPPVGTFLMSPEYLEAARAYTLERLARELHAEWKDLVNWDVACRVGDAPQEILRFALENNVDTIVLGGQRVPWYRASGSRNVDQILRIAPCPVLMVWESAATTKNAAAQENAGRWRRWVSFWQRRLGWQTLDDDDPTLRVRSSPRETREKSTQLRRD